MPHLIDLWTLLLNIFKINYGCTHVDTNSGIGAMNVCLDSIGAFQNYLILHINTTILIRHIALGQEACQLCSCGNTLRTRMMTVLGDRKFCLAICSVGNRVCCPANCGDGPASTVFCEHTQWLVVFLWGSGIADTVVRSSYCVLYFSM